MISILDECSEEVEAQKNMMMSAGTIAQTSDYYMYLYDSRLGDLYLVSLSDSALEEMIVFECNIDGSYTNYVNIYKELVSKASSSSPWISQSKREDDYRANYPTPTKSTTAETTSTAVAQTTQASSTVVNGYNLNETTADTYTTEATTEASTTQYYTEAATEEETSEVGPHNFSVDEPSKAYDTLVAINAVTSTSTTYNTWASAFREAEVKQARALASTYMQKVYDAVIVKNASYRPEAVFSASLDAATNTLVVSAKANNYEGIVCVLNASATVTDNSDEWIRQHHKK